MRFWLDAQLPPALALRIGETFSTEAQHVRDLALRNASDREIFERARSTQANVITKDSDFVELVHRLGPPPQVIWVRCGNVTNAHLKRVFASTFPDALKLLETGESLVEIADA